jgi:hypothetical protein
MNWYKFAQFKVIDNEGGLDTDLPSGQNYTDIGHDWYYGYEDDFEAGNFNYMWQLVNGAIDIEKETEEIYGHGDVERWYDVPETYSGRYEQSGRLSIVRPQRGASQFRQIPQSVKDLLKQKFPEAKELYVY